MKECQYIRLSDERKKMYIQYIYIIFSIIFFRYLYDTRSIDDHFNCIYFMCIYTYTYM